MEKHPAKEAFLVQFTEEEPPRVISYLNTKGSSIAEAEDQLSSVVLDLLLKIKAQTPFLNRPYYLDFCKYAWGAIRNTSLDFRRKMSRKPTLLPLEMEIEDFSNNRINNLHLSQELEELVGKAIDKLTPSLKAIAALAFLNDQNDNYSYHDLSLILGISESAVKKNLLRARKLLREDLEEDVKQLTSLREIES